MRWCILPVHTHSQIRLDLTNQTQNPRRQFFDGWHAVKLVFSPRSKQFTIAQLTESQTSTRQDEDKTEARVSPWRHVGNESSRRIRDLGQYTSKIKVALVLERATPRAHTRSIHRLYNRARPLPIVRPTHLRLAHAPIRTPSTHVTLFTLSTLCTLDYTRYGYVKPIDFVNCRKKAADIQKTRTIRPFTVLFPRTLKNISNALRKPKKCYNVYYRSVWKDPREDRLRSVLAFQAERNRFERKWTRIYGWYIEKKQLIQKTYGIKENRKKRKWKKNEHENRSKIRGLWHTFGCRTDDETAFASRTLTSHHASRNWR